jgi:hypothetical protein
VVITLIFIDGCDEVLRERLRHCVERLASEAQQPTRHCWHGTQHGLLLRTIAAAASVSV